MELRAIPNGAVVVGVDGSTSAGHALDWAARHAAKDSRPLIVVYAVGSMTMSVAWMTQGGIDPTPILAGATKAAKSILDQATARATAAHHDLKIETVFSQLDSREALLQAAVHASVIVVGSRGRGPLKSLLLGSVSSAVVKHAHSPVIVVRPHHPGKVRRGVLVGADSTSGSGPVLEFAFRQASELELPLTVMHTFVDVLAPGSAPHEIGPDDPAYPAASLTLAEAVAGLGEKFPDVHVQRSIVRGWASASLMTRANEMDLVVVGHRHHDLATMVFGESVALGVLEHAATVVAVVPVK